MKQFSFSYFIFTSILLFFSFISFLYFPDSSFFSLISFILSFSFIFKFFYVRPLFLLFIFIVSYNWSALLFFHFGISLSHWRSFNETFFVSKVLLYHTLFIYSFGNFLNVKKFISISDLKSPSNFTFYFFAFISLAVLIFGSSGENIFVSGVYGTTVKKSINEYFIIFIFIMLVSFKSDFQKMQIYFLSFVYIVKNLLMGGRIEVLQLILLLIYFSNSFINISTFKLIALIFLAFYLSSLFALFRNNPLDFFSNIKEYLFYFEFSDSDYQQSNQGDVLQSSARIIGLIENGYLTFYSRIVSFLSFLFSSFTPSTLWPSYTQLATFLQEDFGSGGGGICSTYFYSWFGLLGPIIFGFIIATFINISITSSFRLAKVYCLFIFVMYPRWFAYSPLVLFKFCVYALILYYICFSFLKKFRSKFCLFF